MLALLRGLSSPSYLDAQGTYSLLAKDYDEDVKLIRYIIGLKSQEARQELTFQSLLEMKDRVAPPILLFHASLFYSYMPTLS